MLFFGKFSKKIIGFNNAIFRIYCHPVNGLIAIKKGPSVSALFLNVFWLFYKKLYLSGSLFIVIYLSILIALIEIENNQLYLQFLFWMLLFSFFSLPLFYIYSNGNDMLVKQCLKNGYKFVKIVEAHNAEIAIDLSKNIQVGWTSWQDLNTLE